MNNKTRIWIVVVIVALVGVLCLMNYKPPPTPPSPPPTPAQILEKLWGSAVAISCKPPMGASTADWTLIEFGDFQCPQCGKIHGVIENMVNGSRGHLKLLFVNCPIPSVHPYADLCAAASIAAEQQNKFWPMYDQMYDHQDGLEKAKSGKDAEKVLVADATGAGLNVAKFIQAVQSQSVQSRIGDQLKIVNRLNIQATPSFLLRHGDDHTVTEYIGKTKFQGSSVPGVDVLINKQPWR